MIYKYINKEFFNLNMFLKFNNYILCFGIWRIYFYYLII